MTRDERRAAFERRLAGQTWTEISESLGYTRQAVVADMRNVIEYRQCTTCPVASPALEALILSDYGGSVGAFLREVGHRTRRGYAMIEGKMPMSAELSMAIRSVTGMSEEDINV